eukprot:CAMPEP_0114667946 /NCGR_PEP_ID=MMETSP0191-20121206/35471_1 /TAXON_ID=126664 /ORGANISM="Sorites sp." /LENGTH=252 /DNA_ID=CAMNT_0001919907 /DNA_START=525 /DNA_END=1283 /DNA_ORIENTATION=+
MVVYEWDRDVLHRDVRIVILRSAFEFIRRDKEIKYASEAAWHIFESAITHKDIRQNIEIMTALMGCLPEGETKIDSWFEGLVLKPRLLDHLKTFKDMPIPKRHAERFAKIIIKLCDRVYTEVKTDDDENKDTEMKDANKSDDDFEVVDADGDGDGDGDADTKQDDDVKEFLKDENKDGDANADDDDDDDTFLKNEGKPRCNDDIAFIAMRSLEMWTKWNKGIVKDAVRVCGETITDFTADFIANTNQDINKY